MITLALFAGVTGAPAGAPAPVVVLPIGPHYRPASRSGGTENFSCPYKRLISVSFELVPSSFRSEARVMRVAQIRVGESSLQASVVASLNQKLAFFAAIPTISSECARARVRVTFLDLDDGIVKRSESVELDEEH